MLQSIFLLLLIGSILACNKRQTENGFICVCDENSCDTVEGIDDLTSDKLKVYSTSATEPGFTVSSVNFVEGESSSGTKVRINPGTFQKIIGFGGALTDTACVQILSLPPAAQDKLLESYFGDKGVGYSLVRITVGCSDFSPRPYTLDDFEGDADLSKFSLQPEDLNYKIPVIKRALDMRGDKPLRLFGCYWSPPLWMKTQPIWALGYTRLKDEYYQVFADYLKKFLDGYLENGIKFWGLATGNEPDNGFTKGNPVPSMSWPAANQARWISQNLGPTIKGAHKDVNIIFHDENFGSVPFKVPYMLNNENTSQYIDGVATHWYADGNFPPEAKLITKSTKRDTFTISSEACYFVTHPLLGDWNRAESYINNIFEDLSYDYNGWVDWNMVLNYTGGYTWINLIADAPIIISEDQKEFYKQPMFYVLGHFAKFIIPDSVRQNMTAENTDNVVNALSFTRPDNVRVVTVHNSATNEGSVQVIDGNKFSDNIKLPPQSLTTILYRI